AMGRVARAGRRTVHDDRRRARAGRRDVAAPRVLTGLRRGTVRGTREVLRPGRARMGAVAFRRRAAPGAHRGVRRLRERRAVARDRASASGRVRLGLLRLAGRGLPTARCDAEPLPRVFLVAGTLEPFFLENATRWADALREAGADVVITERVGSHGDAFWY